MTALLYLACRWLGLSEHMVWQLSRGLLNMSITTAYVILAVIAIRFLLKKAPKKFSYLLWIVVAFRLICPFSLELDFSLMNVIDAPVSESGIVEYAPYTMGSDPYLEITLPVTTVDDVINDQLPTGVQQTAGDELEAGNAAAVMIWTFGVDAMLLYALYSWLRLRAALREATHSHENVWLWGGARSPFILGMYRPKIYLPHGLTEEELDYVLRHERCHIRRCDHIVKLFAFFLLTIHWFNPFVWLAFVLMSRDMEMSCDERVLRECGNIRKNYSTTLLSFATGRRFPSPSPLAFGESSVKQRIKNVLKWKEPKVWVTALALALCFAAVIFCAANPVGDKTAPENPFGKTYAAAEVIYDVPDDHHITGLESAPYFCLTGDERLLTREQIADSEAWRPWGNVAELTLEKNNFDGYFYSDDGWLSGSAAKLRRENRSAWQMLTGSPELSWYILQQKDGSLYAVGFYYDSSEAGQGAFDDSAVRVVYRLEETAESVVTPMLMEGVPYVTQQCFYLSPLSSAHPGSDTGLTYTPRSTHLEIRNRVSGEVIRTINMEHDWQWQVLPFTQEEWELLWFGALEAGQFAPVDFAAYNGEKIWMPISGDYALLQMPEDNVLLLIQFFSGPKGESYIWSVHTLVPEESQPLAKWQLPSPYQSARHSAVQIVPDLPYERIVASCLYGKMADYDGSGVSGTVVEFQPGSGIYWSPWQKDGLLVLSDRIELCVERAGGITHIVTLYLKGEKTDRGFDVACYTGHLSCAGALALHQEDGGVFLREMNTSAAFPPDSGAGVLPNGFERSVLVGDRALTLGTYEELPVDLTPFAVSEEGDYLEAYLEHPAPDGGTEWDLMLRANTNGSSYDVLEIGVASSVYPLLTGVAVGDGAAEIAAAYGAEAKLDAGLQSDRATGTSDARYVYEGNGCRVTFYLYEDAIYLITLEKLSVDK